MHQLCFVQLLIEVEVDECELGLDNCSHSCRDTVESYACTCNVGYTLAADGFSCNGEMAIIADVVPQVFADLPVNVNIGSKHVGDAVL